MGRFCVAIFSQSFSGPRSDTMQTLIGLALVGVLSGSVFGLPRVPPKEKEPRFWSKLSEQYFRDQLKIKDNKKVADNVIIFIGDGLGPTTVTAARILRGQINGRPGEENILNFEKFPNIALSKTYNMDRQIPDSGGTATAILSGEKTNWYMIGMDGTTVVDDCEGSRGKQLDTILDWAMEAGKATGIVTTARLTHATPAAAYAHTPNRRWESDYDTVTRNVTGGCKDIALQLIEENPHINVLMGGGRRHFLPNTVVDPEKNTIDGKQRLDGRNLVQEWEDHKKDRGVGYKYAWNKDMFDEIDTRSTDYVLGLFEPSHMQYELERDKSGPTGEPSLAEMTRKAIRILQKDISGYFLMVEGARIDHGHHASYVKHALYETLAFEDAIQEAIDMTDEEDTLIIVTGDHSHAFDIQGYSYRGNDILGIADPLSQEVPLDDKPYTTLIYANGPGYVTPRVNLTDAPLQDPNYVWPSGLPVLDETHGGEDVAVYAKGPMAHMFYGTQEQSHIAHVAALATCIGQYRGKLCAELRDMEVTQLNDAAEMKFTTYLTLTSLLVDYFLQR